MEFVPHALAKVPSVTGSWQQSSSTAEFNKGGCPRTVHWTNNAVYFLSREIRLSDYFSSGLSASPFGAGQPEENLLFGSPCVTIWCRATGGRDLIGFSKVDGETALLTPREAIAGNTFAYDVALVME